MQLPGRWYHLQRRQAHQHHYQGRRGQLLCLLRRPARLRRCHDHPDRIRSTDPQTLLPLAAPQTTTYLAGFILTQRLLLPFQASNQTNLSHDLTDCATHVYVALSEKNQLLESGDFVKNQQKLLPSLQDITKVDLRDLKKCASPKAIQLLLNPAVLAGQVKLHSLRYKFAHSSVAYIRTCNNCCVITEATLLATLQSHLLFASYSPFGPPIMEFLVPQDHSR